MSGRRRFSEVSGFVLAGGASRRMGSDKTRLPLGSESMTERQVRLLRAICRGVSIIGPPGRFPHAGVQVYADDIPGQGPLGGIHTGLRRAGTDFSLFLSCDMPLMEAGFLRYLCEQALESGASATLPPPGTKGAYPLCAVLRRRALSAIRSCLTMGENRVGRFFHKVRRRTLSKAEFAQAGFSPRIFFNTNTPEEYEKVRRQIEGFHNRTIVAEREAFAFSPAEPSGRR